jgi:hypothetical protein
LFSHTLSFTYRYSKHEDKVRAAHDDDIFGIPGASVLQLDTAGDELKTNDEGENAEDIEGQPISSLAIK